MAAGAAAAPGCRQSPARDDGDAEPGGFRPCAVIAQSPRRAPGAAIARLSAGSAGGEGVVRVRVAARVRPLLQLEAAGPRRSTSCVEAAGSTVLIGKSSFTFDHVFGPEVAQEEVYKECVDPLVDATFEGIHGTLLAYGQTGSGKTYTMGTSGLPSVPPGALQLAIRSIFERAEARAAEGVGARFLVSYVEIFTDSRPSLAGKGTVCTEEVRDLLSPGRAHIFASVRMDMEGQVRLDGVGEHEVFTEREAMALLAVGSVSRTTSSTRMNDCSSRSHAIFSIEVIQRRQPSVRDGPSATSTAAKFQFVDLAGSEKVKLSGAEGEQLSQAININHGLFVLGKAITALSEGSAHVPFRESKLTRILQNSLGGNSQTCMIACVSPADANIAETISTLKYAAKAKEIRNRPVVNHLHTCANCMALQVQIDSLRKQARGSSNPLIQQDCLHRRLGELEQENQRLREDSAQLRSELDALRGHRRWTPPSAQVPEYSIELHGMLEPGAADRAAEAASAAAATLSDAEAKAARYEALFERCSERLAALQQALRTSELDGADDLLPPPGDLVDDDVAVMEFIGDDGGAMGSLSSIMEEEDDGVVWLDREARRKQHLMLQVEENYHAVAVLEQQSRERVRQHEAARDIAERELARLQAELDAAQSRQERLEAVQARYDRRLEVLQERNTALEREQKELQRLKTMQRQQETKLKVLQDSIRHVTEERDELRRMLEGEKKRRIDSETRGRKDKCAAQQRIRNLSNRVAALERSSASGYDTDASASSAQRRRGSSSQGRTSSARTSRSPPPARRAAGGGVAGGMAATRSAPPDARGGAAAAVWEELLERTAERALRERELASVASGFEASEARLLEAVARRDRLSVRSEVEGLGDVAAELAEAEAEADALLAALEYKREQVWLARRERDACPDIDVGAAVQKLAGDMAPEDVVAGLRWLVAEAAQQRQARLAAWEAEEVVEAEAAACRAALAELRHRSSEQEQAFDLARSDSESRVAFLLKRLQSDGKVELQDVQDVIGEEAVSFLTRRVAELEDVLAAERQEAKDKCSKRLEQDVELITRCRAQEAEAKLRRAQVNEAEAKAERAVARGAQREAQLLQQVSRLEDAAAEVERRADASKDGRRPSTVEVTWGLEALEDFWRATGLDGNRDELLRSLREDVEQLCEQRLKDHLQWKEELEARVAQIGASVQTLSEQLGEEVDQPPPGAPLLHAARCLESQLAALTSLRDSRDCELADLLERLEATHVRLHGEGFEGALWPPPDASRLHPETLSSLRARLLELGAVEREREGQVAAQIARLHSLWSLVGVRVPEELEPQEAELLAVPPPVSDGAIAYAGQRQTRLEVWRASLEAEVAEAEEEMEAWSTRLAPFGVEPLGPTSADSPLKARLEEMRAAVAGAEELAREFVRGELEVLQAFAEDSALANVREACGELAAISGEGAARTVKELGVLARHWERLALQRESHRKLRALVAAREALEDEMREFDAEASDPNRFKRRGYSGVQENRRRTEHQRRLRALDASIASGTAEWSRREGAQFCLDGQEYRGTEILPPEHTHMYAWTGRQVAQREAQRGSGAEAGPPGRIHPGQAPAGPVPGGAAGHGQPAALRRSTLSGEDLVRSATSPRDAATMGKAASARDLDRRGVPRRSRV